MPNIAAFFVFIIVNFWQSYKRKAYMSSNWRDILPRLFDCYRILMKKDLKLSFLVYPSAGRKPQNWNVVSSVWEGAGITY